MKGRKFTPIPHPHTTTAKEVAKDAIRQHYTMKIMNNTFQTEFNRTGFTSKSSMRSPSSAAYTPHTLPNIRNRSSLRGG